MLTVMLIFLTIKSGSKGCQIYKKETIQLRESKLNAVKPDNGNIELSAKEQTAPENPESDVVNSKLDSEKEDKNKEVSSDVTNVASNSI